MTSPSAAEVRGSVPVVKKLEWKPVEAWMKCSKERAKAFGGEYQIVMLDPDDEEPLPSLYFEIGLGAFMFRFEQAQDPMGLPGETCPRKFPSVAEAKAAAQSDYEQRILSAIDLTALEASQAEVERWREYASTLSAVVLGIAPLAGSEAFKQVAPDTFCADPAYFAHRIAELRQAAHDGKLAKVEAGRATSALTAAQERIAELERVAAPFANFVDWVQIDLGQTKDPKERVIVAGDENYWGYVEWQYFLDLHATLSPAVKEPK